jgi:putative ABC transport system permease protein
MTAGVYGVLSYSVVRRTQEIGVRMALGARPDEVLGMVLWRGISLVAAGVLLGLGGALALTRLLKGFLFEVTPLDPATFALVAGAVLALAIAASAFPAYRAARIDPMLALRCE